MERRAADVQAVRVILTNSPMAVQPPQADAAIWGSETLLQKSLDLWQKKFGHRGQIVLSQEATELGDTRQPTPRYEDAHSRSVSPQLVASTKLVPRSDVPTKKGHLMILVDATQDVWERRWFVLRRPYLHIYKHSNEIEEVTVIGLDGVNVENNQEMESLLGKPFTFTLFTSSNSHALAAPNLRELQSWTTKLDPTRLPS